MNRVNEVDFIHSLFSVMASYLVSVKTLPRRKVFEAIVAYRLCPNNCKCHLVISIRILISNILNVSHDKPYDLIFELGFLQ